MSRSARKVVVCDFEERRTGNAGGSFGESGSLAICGTFTPVTRVYPALTLLGGAVLDCTATALLSRAALPSLRIGWRISTASGWVYEVLRVESSSLDPLWHVELTRRK